MNILLTSHGVEKMIGFIYIYNHIRSLVNKNVSKFNIRTNKNLYLKKLKIRGVNNEYPSLIEIVFQALTLY